MSQARGSRVAFGRLSRLRGIAHYLRGDLAAALADLESARTTYSDGYEHGLPETLAFLALCSLERDDPAGAAALLELPGPSDRWRAQPFFVSYLFAAARVRASEGALEEGLELLLECERVVEETNSLNPAVNPPWRSGGRSSRGRLGQPERGPELALRRSNSPARSGRHIRSVWLCAPRASSRGGPTGSTSSPRRRLLLDRAGASVELARTLTEHGASLRRAGHRREARELLRRGLDLATRCGALAISRRAREELVAAGAKPRRERISGVESLTASELRVAQLAAQGLTNRQIAQDLFITMKTVSAHLGHVVRQAGHRRSRRARRRAGGTTTRGMMSKGELFKAPARAPELT